MENEYQKHSDHDLIVMLAEQMKAVRADIKDLKDGTTERISSLERDKANRKEVEELQEKINELQTMVNEKVEKRLRELEDNRAIQCQSTKDNKNYTIFLTTLGLLILGLIIWHLTGYHI